MKITQRHSVLILFALLLVMTIISGITGLIAPSGDPPSPLVLAAALLILGGLLFFYWRGWSPARYLLVAAITLIVVFNLEQPFLTEQMHVMVFIPVVLALIAAEPIWVIGTAITTLCIMLVRAEGQGIYTTPDFLIHYATIIGGMLLARLVAETAQHTAEDHARQAQDAQVRAEQQAHDLVEKTAELEGRAKQQQDLLNLVATLETPAVRLAEGVLFAPIVGHIDSRRGQMLAARLLESASAQGAKRVILDISGVPVIDTTVARGLLATAQALRLLGCQVTISGISPNVALTLIELNIDLEEVSTAHSPQDALAQHFESLL